MARRYYRYRRSRRGRYRRYRRYYRRLSRFVNGSSRSTVRVKVPITYTASLQQTATASGTQTHGLSPFWNSAYQASAMNSPLYLHYCDLYEEVKCIGMKVRFGITSAIGTSTLPSLRILTAWDRRASDRESLAPPDYADIQDYSTVQSSLAVNNSICKFERSLYASDLLERAQWHDSEYVPNSQNDYHDQAFEDADNNVNFFSPCLWFCCQCPDKAAVTVNYIADITYYFAFRNPRYGGTSTNTKSALDGESVDTRGLPPDAPGGPDDDDAMDVDDLDPKVVKTGTAKTVVRGVPVSKPQSRFFSALKSGSKIAAEAAAKRALRAAAGMAAGAAGAALGRRAGQAVQNVVQRVAPALPPQAAAAAAGIVEGAVEDFAHDALVHRLERMDEDN